MEAKTIDSASRLAAEIRQLEHKHEEDPEGRYFVPLADAYRQLGELEHAELLLRDGLRRHPEYLGAHVVLARCLLDRGDEPGAEAEYRRVLADDPQNLVALRALAELAETRGELKEARHWYGQLLDADPLNEEARRALEPAAEETAPADTPAAAETAWREAEAGGGEGEPEEVGDELVTETIAELYARQGVFDRAVDVYRELLRRRGEDPELRQRLRELERLAAAGLRDGPPVAPLAPPPGPDPFAASGGPATIAGELAAMLAWTPASADQPNRARGRNDAPLAEPPAGQCNGRADAASRPGSPPEQAPAASAPEQAPRTASWQRERQQRSASAAPPAERGDLESFQQWLRSLSG